jgi:hypothetical protein
MNEHDRYVVDVGSRPWRVICAIVGHDMYRTRTWYEIEWGCHRCGLKFKHQWDMFTSTHSASTERSSKT